MSCVSPTWCMAVGDYPSTSNFNQSVTLAELWNGSTWSILPTPSPVDPTPGVLTASSLEGVSCTSMTACMAAGWSFGRGGRTLAERWDGSTWSIVPTQNLETGGFQHNALYGVSCSSANACTAVGEFDNDQEQTVIAERWNGTSWSLQRVPFGRPNPAVNPPAVGSTLFGVSCPSDTACTAVGTRLADGQVNVTLAERWNGSAWSLVHSPNSSMQGSLLTGVSCASTTACMAVGFGGDSALDGPSLAARWNGASWSRLDTPNPNTSGNGLSSVSCSAANACTAVGSRAWFNGHDSFLSLAGRWNGTTWQAQSTPSPHQVLNPLYSVSCPSATTCIAVGPGLAELWS